MRIICPNLSFQLRTEVFNIVIGVVSSVGVPAGLNIIIILIRKNQDQKESFSAF